jgi:hypothetical protein
LHKELLPQTRGISAGAIDLANITSCKKDSFFVKLDNNGIPDYRFFEKVENPEGYCGHVAVVGASNTHVRESETTYTYRNIAFDPRRQMWKRMLEKILLKERAALYSVSRWL